VTKGLFIQSLVAGILAAIAANIYNQIYFFATEIDYSNIINAVSLISLNLIISLLAGLLYWLLTTLFKSKGAIIFNFVYSVGSFACVIIPIAMTLPLSTPNPELFPGLTVPMVFFPVIAWMTIDPLFKKK
jgi:Na+-driven multidrug efflux pump